MHFSATFLVFPESVAGHGWSIFAMPPAEAAFDPAEQNHGAEQYLVSNDLQAEIFALREKGASCAALHKERWGTAQVELPGGGKAGLYLPEHARASGLKRLKIGPPLFHPGRRIALYSWGFHPLGSRFTAGTDGTDELPQSNGNYTREPLVFSRQRRFFWPTMLAQGGPAPSQGAVISRPFFHRSRGPKSCRPQAIGAHLHRRRNYFGASIYRARQVDWLWVLLRRQGNAIAAPKGEN